MKRFALLLAALLAAAPCFAATESISDRSSISAHGRDLVIADDLSVTVALLNNGEEVTGNGYSRQTVTGAAAVDTGVTWKSQLAAATFTASGGTITFDQWQLRSGSAVLDTGEVEEHAVTTGNSAALAIRISSRSVDPTMPVPASLRGQTRECLKNIWNYAGASTEATDNSEPFNEAMEDCAAGDQTLIPFFPSGHWRLTEDWVLPQAAGPTTMGVGQICDIRGEDVWAGATGGPMFRVLLSAGGVGDEDDAKIYVDSSGWRHIGGICVQGASGASRAAAIAVADRAAIGILVNDNPEGEQVRLATGGLDIDGLSLLCLDTGAQFGTATARDHATDNHIHRLACSYCTKGLHFWSQQSRLNRIDYAYFSNNEDCIYSEGGGNLSMGIVNVAPSIGTSVISVGPYANGIGQFVIEDLNLDGLSGADTTDYVVWNARDENAYSKAHLEILRMNAHRSVTHTPWFICRGGHEITIRNAMDLKPGILKSIITGHASDAMGCRVVFENCSFRANEVHVSGTGSSDVAFPLASGNHTLMHAGSENIPVYVTFINCWHDGQTQTYSGEATYNGATQANFKLWKEDNTAAPVLLKRQWTETWAENSLALAA